MYATTSDDLKIAYEQFGTEGPAVLLVMGLGSQMLLWPEAMCEALAARGHRVIRFDNRDVGLSTRLHHLGVPNFVTGYVRSEMGLPVRSPYSLTDMANDGFAVLDHLGIERATVVGASMGGMIAQRMAIADPARVDGLVAIMSSASPSRPRLGALKVLAVRPKPGRSAHVDHFVQAFQAIGSQTHPMPTEEVRLIAERCYDRGPANAGFARQLAAVLADGSRSAALRALDVPSLVIHGAQDPLIPLSYGIRLAKLLRGRLEVHQEMGHDLPPIVWDRIIDGISRHARSNAVG